MFIGRRAGLGIAGAAAYLALAGWAKFSYVDPTPKGAVVVQLYRPFVHGLGLIWRVGAMSPEDAPRLTRDVVIYEDNRALDRAKNVLNLSEVPGQFLYERGVLLFSVRGDPNRNGRIYWAVIPDK